MCDHFQLPRHVGTHAPSLEGFKLVRAELPQCNLKQLRLYISYMGIDITGSQVMEAAAESSPEGSQ